jgi:hypothetical protein
MPHEKKHSNLARNVFFGFVGLSMATAAAFQYLIVYEIHDHCASAPVDLKIPPTIAGSTLAGSFFANGAWLMARGKDHFQNPCAKVALLVWATLVVIGVTAAGATLGQASLYSSVCPDLNSDINFTTLQYVSIALLVFSTVAPHGMRKSKGKNGFAESEGAAGPISMDTFNNGEITEKTPLTFL